MKDFIAIVINKIAMTENDWIGKGYFLLARILVLGIVIAGGSIFFMLAGAYSYWLLFVGVLFFIARFNNKNYSYFSEIKNVYKCMEFIFGDISEKILFIFIVCQVILWAAAWYGITNAVGEQVIKNYSIYFTILVIAINTVVISQFFYMYYFNETNDIQFERMRFLRWLVGMIVALMVCLFNMSDDWSFKNVLIFINTVFSLILMMDRVHDSYSKINKMLIKQSLDY